MPLTGEPALIVGAILAALNAVQVAAISMSNGVHTAILVVTIILGTLVTRAQVSPASKTVTSSDDRLTPEARKQIVGE